MAVGFQRLIQHLDPSLQPRGRMSPDWAGSDLAHRLMIRQDIVAQLPGLTPSEKTQLVDLNQRPQSERWSMSVSHTRSHGGWLALRQPMNVGFDMEMRSRVHGQLLGRMATPEERALAPLPALLWPAKEAVFKAIPAACQPPVITAIELTAWVALGSDLYQFSANVPGYGFATQDETLLFTVFLRA